MKVPTIILLSTALLLAGLVIADSSDGVNSSRALAISSATATTKSEPSIWEIDPVESNPIYHSQDVAFKAAASVYHYRPTVVGTAAYSLPQQISLINEAKSDGAKAIIYCDVDPTSYKKTVLAAEKAGIVMISVGCVDSDSTYSIGQSLVALGQLSAETIAKREGPDAKVALFAVSLAIPNTTVPYDAFVAYAKKHYPKMKVIVQEADSGDPGTAATDIGSVIEGYPNVNAFWMLESGSGAVMGKALQAAGKRPGQIFVLGLDALPGTLSEVKAGWIPELVSRCFFYVMPFAAGLAVARLDGHGLKQQFISVPSQLVRAGQLPYHGCPSSYIPKVPS